MSEKVFDDQQRLIAVGTSVFCLHPGIVGVVTGISDLDGDAASDGTPLAVYPKVTVKWPSGAVEDFGTYPSGKVLFGHDPEVFACDDLVVSV